MLPPRGLPEGANRALIHVPAGNRTWVAKYNRDADAEAPAGGASSSVRDLARWLRLQLANGSYDGKRFIDAEALGVTHIPNAVSGLPATPGARTGSTAWAKTSPMTTAHDSSWALRSLQPWRRDRHLPASGRATGPAWS
jgi:CubicO group peptidase (beta-lactamase class C family)